MRNRNIRALLVWRHMFAAAVATVLLAAPPAFGQNGPESFTGFAINLNNQASTATVDFTIQRWSTDAERDQLLAILKEEKNTTRANEKLLTALQKMPKVGSIRTPTTLAWDLRFARQSPLEDGGRRVILATDRPVGFREARNQNRTMDYPFTIIEVQLDKNDKGVGKILGGTKLYIDKNNNLVLENYAQQPIRFNEIRKVK